MRFKEVTEPANIGRMQQRIDGVGDENEGQHDPDDIEAATRIVRLTSKPISLHNVSQRRSSPHERRNQGTHCFLSFGTTLRQQIASWLTRSSKHS
jgi:hypothetical protein